MGLDQLVSEVAKKSRATQPRVVYLGGPIDYAVGDSVHELHHRKEWKELGLTPYCPRCECVGLSDEQAMLQNMLMVRESALAIFDLRFYSIGTPIEMFLRCWVHEKPAILIGTEDSLFVRQTLDRFPGHTLVSDLEEALSAAGTY